MSGQSHKLNKRNKGSINEKQHMLTDTEPTKRTTDPHGKNGIYFHEIQLPLKERRKTSVK